MLLHDFNHAKKNSTSLNTALAQPSLFNLLNQSGECGSTKSRFARIGN